MSLLLVDYSFRCFLFSFCIYSYILQFSNFNVKAMILFFATFFNTRNREYIIIIIINVGTLPGC